MAVVFGIFLLAVAGCGTVSTVLRDEAEAAHGLRKHKTYCQSIPRIYSGLAYDFCILNAPPDSTGILAPAILLDMTVSGVLDTFALPYTVYRQSADGSINIYWRPGRG